LTFEVGGKILGLFNDWISKIFPRKTILFGATPAIKNDQSLWTVEETTT
jgi:hypothetical protein